MGLFGPGTHLRKSARLKAGIAKSRVLNKKTGTTSDVAPAEETALNYFIAQTARATDASGRGDNILTTTKLTSPAARL